MANRKVKFSVGDLSIQWEYTIDTFSHGINTTMKEVGKDWGMPGIVDKWAFETIAVTFPLVVEGGDKGIGSTDDLNAIVNKLYKASIPKLEKSFGRAGTLSVGNWFSVNGFITNVTFDHQAPYDSNGVPMRVEVNMQFQPVMKRKKSNGTTTWRPIYRDEFSGIDSMT